MKLLKFIPAMLVALVIVLVACGAPTATEAPTAPAQSVPLPGVTASPAGATIDPNFPASGGTVVIGILEQPATLNPLLASTATEYAISSFVIEGLIQTNERGEYVPVLAAELPSVSADGLTVTYRLRGGVKFSDGSDFNCDDVKFTLAAILSGPAQVNKSGYDNIKSLECTDPYTVVAVFEDVYAPYLSLFPSILPDTVGDPAFLETWELFNRAPVGTGSWMVQDWVAGDHITLIKNPNYREAGKPYLDSLIVKKLSDHEAGLKQLASSKIDLLWGLTEADLPVLAQMENITFAATPTGENEMLVLNLADPWVDAPADPVKAPHPVLSDLRVRQAIQAGIDKQKIVDALFSGNVNTGTSVLSAGEFACPQPASQFDPARARSLLEEAGWATGADGTREKDGEHLSLRITSTSGDPLREQTEQMLAVMLRDIGIELVVENVPSDELFATWDENGPRKHGRFDLLLYTTGLTLTALDPDGHLFSNYHSERIPTTQNGGAGNNFSRYINADVDSWIDEAARITDTAERKELYCRVAGQINADIPRIFLYERLHIAAYRVGLQNLVISPGMPGFSWGSQNWWIKP